MRKNILITLTVFTFMFLIIVSSYPFSKNIQTITEISITKFESKIINRDSFIIMIGRKECLSCNKIKKQILNEDQMINNTIYYLEINNANSKDVITKLNTYFGNIEYVPFFGSIKNGKVTSFINNISDLKSLKDWIEIDN